MHEQYELIVFDWDGTLMDSETKIVRCFAAAANDTGISHVGDDAVRNIIGLGLHEAIETLYPGTAPPQREQLIDRYREHFLYLDKTEMNLFPGVAAGLEQLLAKGYRLAVATGKARRGLERVLDQTATRHLFETTRCADEAVSKPHPQMLYDILHATGASSARALMVGDTVYDLQMAHQAGMASLAVSYGVHEQQRLMSEKPLACLESFNEVCHWLL
jgi:phosphoglycolate phosphatase